MRVLLVAPSVDTCYERVLPIGLMSLFLIGNELRSNFEYDIELMDLSVDTYKRGLVKILTKQYDLIGISCNFTNVAPYCIRYAKDIKRKYPDTMIISGGNHATLVPEDLLFNEYDYVICGEGEITFKEFLQRLLSGESVRDLKGICYLDGGKIMKNLPRESIRDLDTLPLNDYSKFNLEPYFKWTKMRYINIETSRGCIYNCAFCATVKMWGRQYRHKSPQRIVEEFKIAKKLGCLFIFLCDDDTAIDEQNLRNFCELLIKEKVIIPWGTTIGGCSIKNKSTFDIMAKSGCVKINICIESANPRILKEYRKPYTIEDNKRICINLRKRGIIVHNHGIIGFPDETLRETLNTYLYLIKTSPLWHISILEPRPGTDYWESWDKKGDVFKYKLFGKANVLFSKKKISTYLIYRFFALYYFLSPIRLYNALFHKIRGIRYSYWIQYYVAYRTLNANFLICLELYKKSFIKILGVSDFDG